VCLWQFADCRVSEEGDWWQSRPRHVNDKGTVMGVGPMMSFHNKAGRQLVQGLPQQLIGRLMARGASPGHVPDSVTYCSTVTPFDSEVLKEELEVMVNEWGGTILFHTQFAGVEVRDGRVEAVVLCHKGGLTRETARCFVDATGDADFAARAGVPFRQGRKGDSATPGVFTINTSRIQGLDATDPYQLSRAETEGRRQCRQIYEFLKNHCPGFERALFMSTGPQVGVRESRHVEGLHTLKADELVRQEPFPDAIAVGGYPIDIHSPTGESTESVHLKDNIAYAIPLRSLVVASPQNLVFVGRGISATHEASAAFRVTPIAMAIGQAGGTLAALSALDSEKRPANVFPYELVRARLLADGAFLG